MAKNDQKIKDLLSTIEKQKAKLGSRPRATLNTNGVFKKSENDFVNLNTIRSKEVIVDYVAFLLQEQEARANACKWLGIEPVPFAISGFKISDWLDDFKLRLEVIVWEEENKKLEALKTKLNSLISEEAKTDMALADIESMLGK